jgi:maltose/moltooligosaccharide transporter
MGIFNFFIVLPEIGVSLGFGWVMENLLGDNRLMAVVIGGGFMVIAAALTQRIQAAGAEAGMPEFEEEVELPKETAVET